MIWLGCLYFLVEAKFSAPFSIIEFFPDNQFSIFTLSNFWSSLYYNPSNAFVVFIGNLYSLNLFCNNAKLHFHSWWVELLLHNQLCKKTPLKSVFMTRKFSWCSLHTSWKKIFLKFTHRVNREDSPIIPLDTKSVPDFVLHACCFFITSNRPV